MSAVRPTAIQLADVIQLPVSDRLKLVGQIWDSIAAVPDAIELSEAQRSELQRRLDDYHKNPNIGSPWAEVKARIVKRS
jgi:putative addiction module component (TIGR02574 family)